MRELPLHGRVALVTGGTGPIGRAIVTALAAEGARVAVLHHDAAATPAPTGAEMALRADVTDAAAVEAAVDQIVATLGEVDVLICNAGHRLTGSFLALEAEDLRRCIEVDVLGTLLCIQQVAGRLAARRAPGRIVAVTSVAGLRALPGACAHAIAQAMATTLTQVAAVELGAEQITCNVIATGWVEAPLMDRVNREIVVAATPAGRLIDPAEIGSVCAYLAHPSASAVNGAVITVDGGYSVTKSPGGSPLLSTP